MTDIDKLHSPTYQQLRSAVKAAPPASALRPGMIIAAFVTIRLVVFGAGLWRVLGR